MEHSKLECLLYKPRRVREREERMKENESKHQSYSRRRLPRKTGLEAFKEKSIVEASLLNSEVTVDDGSLRKIYSSCTFEQVKRYDCNVCVMSVFGKTNLIHHHQSRHHYDMMQRHSHPHENFDENKCSVIMRPTTQAYIQTLLLEEPPKDITLVAMEYLVELIEPVANQLVRCYFFCLLCEKNLTDPEQLMLHVTSAKHRLLYLMLFFPSIYKKLVLLSNMYRCKYADIACFKIMKRFGWLKPWHHEGKLSLKEKRSIRYSVDVGPHISEKQDQDWVQGLSDDIPFAEVTQNLKVRETVLCEFLLFEDESHIDWELYQRQKGVDTCKQCKARLGEELVERIIHPFTGRHLEHFAKGMTIYDSVAFSEQKYLDSCEGLLGTEYIVEYINDLEMPMYTCMLCRKTMNEIKLTVSHLVSMKHKQRYIKHHMPGKDTMLLKLSGPERDQAIRELIKICEAKFWRLPPWSTLYDIKLKVNSTTTLDDYILKKIINGLHIGWSTQRNQPIEVKGMPVPFFSVEPNQEKKKKVKLTEVATNKPSTSHQVEGKKPDSWKKKSRSHKSRSRSRSGSSNSSASRELRHHKSRTHHHKSKSRHHHRSSRSRSRSRSYHRRSRSWYSRSSSLDSDSTAARQRGLSPELPQCMQSTLDSWVASQAGLSIDRHQLIEEEFTHEQLGAHLPLLNIAVIEFADNSYLTNYPPSHQEVCKPQLIPQFRLGKERFWLSMCFNWIAMNQNLFARDQTTQSITKQLLKIYIQIMMESAVYVSGCQPTCRSVVEKMLKSVCQHHLSPQLSQDECLLLARGIVRVCNQQTYFWHYWNPHDKALSIADM